MEDAIIRLVIIAIVGTILWIGNEKVNRVQGFKEILSFAIIAVCALMSIKPIIAIVQSAF